MSENTNTSNNIMDIPENMNQMLLDEATNVFEGNTSANRTLNYEVLVRVMVMGFTLGSTVGYCAGIQDAPRPTAS